MERHLIGLVWILCLICPFSRAADSFDHTHGGFKPVLDAFLRDGRVDYAALKTQPQSLDSYLDRLAGVTEAQFMDYTAEQKIAFLINLYNASTLKLVISHYPIARIKDIGNWFRGPFDQKIVRFLGRSFSLGDIEHGILRRNHNDEPRFHFALVCASLGCPPLRPEPYRAADLDGQLADQTRRFLADKSRNFIEPRSRTLHLSPIFKWFEKDFLKRSDSVIAFVAEHLPEDAAREITTHPYKVEHTEYDWSLNDARTSAGGG